MKSFLSESPEDRELHRRKALKKRLSILSLLLVAGIVARIVIKDPPPPKSPDEGKAPIRVLPGMLQAIPQSAQTSLPPQVIAKMQTADTDYKNRALISRTMVAQVPHPLPTDVTTLANSYLEEASYYRRKRPSILEESPLLDRSKTVLVSFRSGGFIKVEKTQVRKSGVEIILNRHAMALVPQHMVRQIKDNAFDWQEPIPAGFSRIQPAKGVTMVLLKGTAKRIQPKEDDDES